MLIVAPMIDLNKIGMMDVSRGLGEISTGPGNEPKESSEK
jgi:hypothetical protein